MRLANLPNGAVAELCELSQSEAQARTVSVALQRDGEPRIQTEVACTSSLWTMLERLEVHSGSSLVTGVASRGQVSPLPKPSYLLCHLDSPTQAGDNLNVFQIPNVIFMNKAIEGEEQLRRTTLAQLGAVTGSALMKYSCKPSSGAAPDSSPTISAPAAPVPSPQSEARMEVSPELHSAGTAAAAAENGGDGGDGPVCANGAGEEQASLGETSAAESAVEAADPAGDADPIDQTAADVDAAGSSGGGGGADSGDRPWTVGKPRSHPETTVAIQIATQMH